MSVARNLGGGGFGDDMFKRNNFRPPAARFELSSLTLLRLLNLSVSIIPALLSLYRASSASASFSSDCTLTSYPWIS